MKQVIILLLLAAPLLAYSQVDSVEKINAYSIIFGKSKIFEKPGVFLAANGLPYKVQVGKTDYTVKSKEDLFAAIQSSISPLAIITLYYPGYETWYDDRGLLPYTVDVRKITDKLTYNDNIELNKDFTLEQYGQMFPLSYKKPLPAGGSLFEMITGEKGEGYKSFMVNRISKDGAKAHPTIEFTFYNGKLVYIVFWNVS